MNPLVIVSSLPLRIKLALGLLVSVIIIAALSVYTAVQYSQAIQPAANVIVQTIAAERSGELASIVSHNVQAVEGLARNPLNVSYFTTLIGNPNSASARQQVEQGFRAVLNSDPTFRSLRYVLPDGRVLVSEPPTPKVDDMGEAYYKALKDHPITNGQGSGFVGESDDEISPTFDFVSVVRAGDEPRGYVVLDVDPSGGAGANTSNLFNTLRIVSPPTGLVIFYLVSPTGRITSPSIVPTSNRTGVSDPAALAKVNSTDVIQYVSPVSGATVIGYVTPIDQLGMSLVTETRLVELGGSNEAGQFLLKLIGLLAVGAAALGLIAVFLELTVISPTRRLLDAATRVSQGRALGEIAPLRQRDELGGLYNAFIVLTSQLRQDIRALEERVAQRTRDIEATRDIGQIISSIHDLDILLTQVVDLIRQRFPAIYHAQVFLVDTRGEFAVLRVSTGEAGEKLLARGHRLAVGSQSVIGQVTVQGQPVVALDTSTSPIHRVNELLPDTRAELALPLRSGAMVIGALDLQSTQVEAFTEADIRLFQSIADQLSIAITNAELFAESRARVAEIEELNRQLIGEAWRNYASARRNRLPAASTGGDEKGWSEFQRHAIQTGEVVEFLSDDQVTLAVPVSLRGEVLGAVEWDMPRASYNENVRQLAQELAARLAITADNARLFEQSQRLAERERLVNTIASKLTEQTDVTQILKIAVQEVGHALRVPQTSIRLATSRDTEN